MSWFPVAHRLADNGIAVTRVKGKRVKALRRYLSEHAKTDLADAHVLAAIPGFGGPELAPLHIPAPKSHALQRLSKQRSNQTMAWHMAQNVGASATPKGTGRLLRGDVTVGSLRTSHACSTVNPTCAPIP